MAFNPIKGVVRWFRDINPYDPDRLAKDGLKPIEIEESSMRGHASRWIVLGFVAFFAWAIFAPLDAGVNVPGSVVVMGNRKVVQHPNGGVVEQLLVKEGSQVKQGELLIKLNPLSIQAELSAAESEYISALATESRLQAERTFSPTIQWIPELRAMANHPRTRDTMQLQEQLFRSRRDEFRSQDEVLKEQIAGLESYAVGLRQIIQARGEQLAIMTSELRSNDELASEGFVPRSRVNDIQRQRIDSLASTASTSADLAKTQNSITGNRLQLAQHRSTFLKDVDTQVADVQKNRNALHSKIESLRFNLSLTELRAPVTGTVVGLKVFTVGGVIQGSQVLMEIVPKESTLIAEVQVPTNMIDKVHAGLEADMRFQAFNINTTPVVPGRVTLVAVDKVTGPSASNNSQQAEYYLAQIQTTDRGFALLGDKVIQPGMPVDVIIKTGERSFMSYLLKPLSDRFAKSFKEN